MPRDQVNHNEPYIVKVGWQRDADVQIGVEADQGRSLFWQLLGDEETRSILGEQMTKIVSEGPKNMASRGEDLLNALDVVQIGYQGLWSNLSRYDCNTLIRLVRRARDQAFGKDE